jgi:hypothetical protein
MIFHASITAADPARTARAIAAIWDGRALPVPFIADGTWVAMTGDDNGTLIEVLPLGTEFHHLPGEHVDVRSGEARGPGGFHLLIHTPHNLERIVEIACAHGFDAHPARHGQLDVIEVWIDGCFLLEVITPEMQAAYRASVTIPAAEALSSAVYGPEVLAA